MQLHSHVTRRDLIKTTLAAAAVSLVPSFARASLAAAPARSLQFYNTHTAESLKTVYWENGSYIPEALGSINHILRDFRTNTVKPIDPRLLDLLASLHNRLDSNTPFEIISGYRSPQTNAALHARSSGVASHSMHIEGKAIDIRLTDKPLAMLHNAALAMNAGGVGYYPGSDFVHVDTGRVRHW
jgi:uncharacterized protein YcbK (DUF882 family)